MTNFNIEEIGIFRKANPTDIVEGATVFLIGDGSEMHRKTIDEVMKPDDQWKAFCADDGCRYGLNNLYVLKSNSDLYARINYLENIVKTVVSVTENYS